MANWLVGIGLIGSESGNLDEYVYSGESGESGDLKESGESSDSCDMVIGDPHMCGGWSCLKV